MEPLSALSIAATVVQFVDFTIKAILTAREIHKNGSSVSVAAIKKTTEELRSWVAGLTATQDNAPGVDENDITKGLKAAYEALQGIVTGCVATANELIDVLEKLSPVQTSNSSSKHRSSWASIYVALNTIYKKEDIEAMVKQLESYRQEISLHLLAVLNAKTDVYSSQLSNRLDSIDTRIVEILTFTQSLSETIPLSERSRHSMPDATQRTREGVNGAVLRLSDGKTVMLGSRKLELGDNEASSLNSDTENLMAFTEQPFAGLRHPIYIERWSSLAAKVLGYLHFRVINLRLQHLSKAHTKTFDWIFAPPKRHSLWSDFSHWLRESSGIYWITGKPGSGKSTLMKYIHSHSTTHDFLEIWKGSDVLATAHFFFWAPGTSLQKSQEGLLRALLHSLLSQCPQLIPSAFPDLFNELLAGKNPDHSLTVAELQAALHMLIESSRGIKFCLFVDGLDEYAGDHPDIVQTFDKLSSFPYVKIVISSRPWTVFLDAFGTQPRLRLQDLTAGDIRRYISDSLSNSNGLREIRAINPELYPTLVSRICGRASGVFLWVRLAVKSILLGLQDADTVTDLYRRIDELPEDLELMYKKIFDGLGSARNAAARMILMVMGAQTSHSAVTTLQLALIDESNPTLETVIAHQISPMPANHLRSMCETMKRRINSRTRGLLEVSGGESFESDDETKQVVEFFHRTAMDFFMEAQMWGLLRSLTGARFDPEMAILASRLYELKVLPIMTTINTEEGRRWETVREALWYTYILERQRSQPFSAALDDMERSMEFHWQAATRCEIPATTEGEAASHNQERKPTWATHVATQVEDLKGYQKWAFDLRIQPFLSLGIFHSCVLSVADKVTRIKGVTLEQRGHIVHAIMHDFFDKLWEDFGDITNWGSTHTIAISQILHMKADAISVIDCACLWESLARDINKASSTDPAYVACRPKFSRATRVLNLVSVFLDTGAGPPRVFTLPSQDQLVSLPQLLERFRKIPLKGEVQEKAEFDTKYEEVMTRIKAQTCAGPKQKTHQVSLPIRRIFGRLVDR
ncbi:hypothetical protein B0T19DRAFT_270955 [Cercophora scortea]|uniref:NACHT domain-containing protein n=1 Tax=Cercophora scortea TaxID=314031 RepID=A0AAE0I750_9PEZI|nr:hypothetical protein B0T19DRAFT_270955 [Cercophora scortea]